jgi:hypothetical protein
MSNSEKNISILFNLANDLLQASRQTTMLNFRVQFANKLRSDIAISEMALAIKKPLYDAFYEAKINDDIFENHTCFATLVIMSGGNRTQMYRFLYELFGCIEKLPVTQKDVNRVVSEAKTTYSRAIEAKQWDLLAKVYQKPFLDCHELPEYNWLRESRAILWYSDAPSYWLVNPLILDLFYFKEAVGKLA